MELISAKEACETQFHILVPDLSTNKGSVFQIYNRKLIFKIYLKIVLPAI